MILHPINTAGGNSGATVNFVLLNPQPDALAGLTPGEVKQKVIQHVADNLIENYKVSDKIWWGLDFKEDTDMHKMKKDKYSERRFKN